MRCCLFITVLLALAVCGQAFMGRFPFRRGSHFPFPACQNYMAQVEQQMRVNRQNGEGGPWNCRSRNLTMSVCRFEDMMQARNQMSGPPSQECTNQMYDFIEGASVTTTDDSNSTT